MQDRVRAETHCVLVRFWLELSMEEEDGWERAVAWIERDLVMWLAGTVKLTIQEAEARNCLVGNQGRRLMEAPGHPNSARKQNIHSCAIGLMNVVCAALMVADVHIEGKRDVGDGGEVIWGRLRQRTRSSRNHGRIIGRLTSATSIEWCCCHSTWT